MGAGLCPVKVLAERRTLVIDKAGETGLGLWAIDAPLTEKAGLPSEYARLAAGEPRTEAVQQLTADGVATICQNKYGSNTV